MENKKYGRGKVNILHHTFEKSPFALNQRMESISSYSYKPKELAASYVRMKQDGLALLLSTNDEGALGSTAETTKIKTSSDGSVIVAAVQLTGSGLSDSDVVGFCQRCESAIIDATTNHSAQLVLLPELFAGPYFCQTIHNDLFALADPIFSPEASDSSSTVVENVLIQRMKFLAKQYHVVLPVSIYEQYNNMYYNTVVMVDNDGTIIGTPYRKSHIPDAIGYQEKFYFTPGDTGFQVYNTSVGKIGVGICWDQWFPEVARSLVLMGAEIIVYPTAIGNEPEMPEWDTSDHWQRVMQGHSAANFVPVIAANRYGTEILLHDNDDDNNKTVERQRMTFYGKSFITDCTGKKAAEVVDGKTCETKGYDIITASINVSYNQNQRRIFGCFRDRRPDLYGAILTKDGFTLPSTATKK